MLRHVTISDIFQNHPIQLSSTTVDSAKKSKDYRNRVERKSKSKSGVNRLAKNASNRSKPRPPKYTPDFEPTPGEMIQGSKEKVKCYVEETWPEMLELTKETYPQFAEHVASWGRDRGNRGNMESIYTWEFCSRIWENIRTREFWAITWENICPWRFRSKNWEAFHLWPVFGHDSET